MIDFNYETEFVLDNEAIFVDWLNRVVDSENAAIGQVDYVFCDDEYLLRINQEYLSHDAYTDIISFDYSENRILSGDIFISIDRVKENAIEFEVDMEQELLRVMAHGILHFLGYKDKSLNDSAAMRSKEEEKIKMFHVEQ